MAPTLASPGRGEEGITRIAGPQAGTGRGYSKVCSAT
jgi:hypothetical protein